MDSRAQFEAWWAENMFIGGKCFADEQTKRRCLRAWQASRTAIEVELPGKVMVEDEYDRGHNYGIQYCEEAFKAAGLRIKGESS